LSGTTAANITGAAGQGRPPVVRASVKVTQGTTTYAETDYTVTPGAAGKGSTPDTPATIARTAASTIPDGATVTVSYVYAAAVYREGETLYSLDYAIDRRELFSKIVVHGTKVSGTWTWSNAAAYGVSAARVDHQDIPELTTVAQCNEAAARLGANMVTKARQMSFSGTGAPWLEPGDCMQAIESSTTISEIYRTLVLTQGWADEKLTTSGTSYHYGFAPLE
jgi:hypothetical protein